MSSPVTYADRFLLRKAAIVRRVPPDRQIELSKLLHYHQLDMKALAASESLPYYFSDMNDADDQSLAVTECASDGILEISSNNRVSRTRTGELFLRSLEPRLVTMLDEIPMSLEDLLDYLAMQ